MSDVLSSSVPYQVWWSLNKLLGICFFLYYYYFAQIWPKPFHNMLENSLLCSEAFLVNSLIFLLSRLKPSVSKPQFDLESDVQGLLSVHLVLNKNVFLQ